MRKFYFLFVSVLCLFLIPCKEVRGQGELWGVTQYGGTYGGGVIYKTDVDGANFSVKNNFVVEKPGLTPFQNIGVVCAQNGKFYTINNPNNSMLIEYDPATQVSSVKVGVMDNFQTGLALPASNGKIYFLTYAGGLGLGSLNQFDPATGAFTTIHNFNYNPPLGAYPTGLVEIPGGKLLGISLTSGSGGGGLFEYDTSTGVLTSKLSFPNGSILGYGPGGLIQGTNGLFYFQSSQYLYEYNYTTNTVVLKKDFGSGLNIGFQVSVLDKLYGISNSAGNWFLMEYDIATNTYLNKYTFPFYAPVSLSVDGQKIYGVEPGNGTYGKIFEFDPISGNLLYKTDLAVLGNVGSLSGISKAQDGKFYGTTSGLNGWGGMLYRFDLAANSITKIHDYGYTAAGAFPLSGLTKTSYGRFFGVTSIGGAFGKGVLYEFSPSTSTYTKKIDFNETLSVTPGQIIGQLVEHPNGNLYGVMYYGGIYGNSGVLFEYNPILNSYTKRWDFIGPGSSYSGSAAKSFNPSNLTLGPNNKLYGSALNTSGFAPVIFEFDPATGEFSHKASANSIIASRPSKLTTGPNGNLYGTSGANIFELDMNTFAVNLKYTVTGTGGYPLSEFQLGANGKFYSTFGPTGYSAWFIFEFDPANSSYTKLFTSSNWQTQGRTITSSLLLPNGKMYITLNEGGNHSGMLNEFNLNTSQLTTKYYFDSNGFQPVSLLYAPSNQSITFNALPQKTYGDLSFDLTATATSNLEVIYASSNPSVATINGKTVTIIGAGTTTITAMQPGDIDFKPATAVQQTLVVNKATLTATAIDQNKTYGDTDPNFTFSYSGFKLGETESVIDTTPTASPTVSAINAGTYTIGLSGGLDNNYSFNFVTGTFIINKATLTATANNQTKTYVDADPSFTISYSGFKSGETESVIDTPPTAAPTVSAINAGTYTIGLSGGLDNNYSFNFVTGTFIISKSTLVATANNQTKTYVDADPSFTISYSGFKSGEAESVIDTPPTAAPTVSSVNVGIYTIGLSGGLDNNYLFSFVTGTFTIIKSALTVTADNQTKIYGDTDPNFSISYLGFKSGETESVIDIIPLAAPTVSAINSGTYTIGFSGGSDNNYSFNFVTGTFIINKATLTATADNKNKAYGDDIPGFTVSYSGFKFGETELVIDTPPIASTSATKFSNVGSYDIILTGGSDNNYVFSFISGTLTINKADQIITFSALALRAYGDPNFFLTASGGASGNPVTFSGDNSSIVTINGNEVTVVGAGSTTITASQMGNSNYNDAVPVDQIQVVILPKPTIPTSYIFLVNEFATQIDYYALHGDGNSRLVVLKKDSPVDFVPVDDIGYSLGQPVGINNDNFIGLVLTGAIDYGTIKNLEPGASYYVKVFEFNQSNGFYSYLTTAAGTSGQVTMPQLTVQVISPVNNALNVNAPTSSLVTSSIPGATSYTVELYTNSFLTGSPVVGSSATTTVAFTNKLAYSTQYFARVKTNLSNDYGPISTFTTEPSQADAFITAPANNSTGNLVFPTVTSNTVAGATTYYIELSTYSDFSNNVITNPAGGGASQNFTNLDFSTTYYARVRTNLSPNWGVTRSFTTGDALSLSYVTSPVNNATGQVPTLNVTSNALTGATAYTIQLSPDVTFSTGIISLTNNSRTINFPQLAYNTKYYSRVMSSITPTEWGPIRNFTTINHTFQTAPANNSVNVFVSQTITASAISGAPTNSYVIEASTTSTFDPGTVIVKTGSRTQTFNGLEYSTQYFIRARCSLAANGSYGTVLTFTTGSPQSLAVVTAPANGATVSYSTSIPITARVLPAGGSIPAASSYTIELNTQSDFSGTSIVQTSLTNIITFTSLSPSTIYYTRVKTDLDSNWGTTYTSFTTSVLGGRFAADPQPVAMPIEPLAIKIFGNPFKDELAFIVNSSRQEDVEIMLTDLNGRQIHRSTETTNSMLLLQTTIDSGVYLLLAKTSKEHEVIRVIKE